MVFVIMTTIEAVLLAVIFGAYVYRRVSAERAAETDRLIRDALNDGKLIGYQDGYTAGYRVGQKDAERLRATLINAEVD